MTVDQVVVLVVLAGAFALFVSEALPLGVTGLGIIAVLGLAGTLSPPQALGAFASPAVVLVGSLYVLSAALIRTGVVATVEDRFVRRGRGSEGRLLVTATLATTLASMILNNTSVVVLMLPLALGAARTLKLPPSRLLMPISFAAILGGTMTLIGTSTNVLVADLARDATEIRFFDFLPMGAGFAAVGLLYIWLVGPRALPSRATVSSVTQGRTFEYVTELTVRRGSVMDGLSLEQLSRRVGGRVLFLQHLRGEELLDVSRRDQRLEPGDVVVLRAAPDTIVTMRRDLRMDTLAGGEGGDLSLHKTTFAEIVVTPTSQFVGRTLGRLGLHRTFGVVALALQRRGAHLRRGILDVPLRVGDVVLIQGEPERIEGLRGGAGFLLLVGVDEQAVLRRRAPAAIAVLLLFLVFAATGAADLPLLTVGAAVACLAAGCLSLNGAIRAVNWNVLGLLAGAIALGYGLGHTGLAAWAAGVMVGVTRDLGPVAVLSAIYLLTAIATELVSNAGAAALMVPIALAAAGEMGVSVRPFVFAVAFAASASFSTPVGYQTNALILGPGGYRFRDFIRFGLPLQILLWIYASLALPFFFPF